MRHILSLILFATIMSAQPQPPTPPSPPIDALKTYLTLTDQQVTQMQTIARQQGEAMRQRQQEIGTKQQQLDTQLRNGSTDAAALGRLLLDIENLRRQIESTRKSFSDQAIAVLTQAQKDKLKSLSDAALLAPAIQQAIGVNLISPPAPVPGGPRPMEMFGPRMMGRPAFRRE